MCGAGANQSRQRPGSKYSSITTQRLKKRDDAQQEGRRQRSLWGQLPLTSPNHSVLKAPGNSNKGGNKLLQPRQQWWAKKTHITTSRCEILTTADAGRGADSYLIVQKLHRVHLKLVLFCADPLGEKKKKLLTFLSVLLDLGVSLG